MQALHANAIVGEGDPALSPLAKPLVEPLRITLDALDLESISKLWTATTQPLRLSVGYEVSLVVVDALDAARRRAARRASAGSPSRRRIGPRLARSTRRASSFGDELLVAVEGLTAGAAFTLAREAGDPAGRGRLADDAVAHRRRRRGRSR